MAGSSRAATHRIGVHPIDTGGLDMAVRRAAAAGATAIQIFSAIPKFYGDKSSISPGRVARFEAALAETAIAPESVVVHGAYVLNVATEDAAIWSRAAAGLVKELERSRTLGVGMVCFHPGSAKGGDRRAAAQRVATAIAAALEAVPGSPRLLVENTAGAGHTLGRTAEEVAAILDALPPKLRARSGYGLDTCHLFASGYRIHDGPASLRATLDAFEQATGEPPAFFHCNDSEGACGSNRDRHVLLGEGGIGLEPFRWLLADRRSRGVPLILETPEVNLDIARDDPTPDPWDARMIALLGGLAAEA
jgi:deoxyribonuclease-4